MSCICLNSMQYDPKVCKNPCSPLLAHSTVLQSIVGEGTRAIALFHNLCVFDNPFAATELSNTTRSFMQNRSYHARVKAHIMSPRSPRLRMHAHSGVATNIGIQKLFLKAISGFSRKFTPAKMTRYMVVKVTWSIQHTIYMTLYNITQYGSTVYIGMALVWPAL